MPSLSCDRLFHGSPVLGIIALETASTTMDQQQQKTATATSTRRAPTKIDDHEQNSETNDDVGTYDLAFLVVFFPHSVSTLRGSYGRS